jgi:hypothetical protein
MTSAAQGARWLSISAGAFLGIALTWLVYVPAGAPNGGQVIFPLSLLTIIAGFVIGDRLRKRPTPTTSHFGEAILGLGIGAALGLASFLLNPFGYI